MGFGANKRVITHDTKLKKWEVELRVDRIRRNKKERGEFDCSVYRGAAKNRVVSSTRETIPCFIPWASPALVDHCWIQTYKTEGPPHDRCLLLFATCVCILVQWMRKWGRRRGGESYNWQHRHTVINSKKESFCLRGARWKTIWLSRAIDRVAKPIARSAHTTLLSLNYSKLVKEVSFLLPI